jgi:hypothetical protein
MCPVADPAPATIEEASPMRKRALRKSAAAGLLLGVLVCLGFAPSVEAATVHAELSVSRSVVHEGGAFTARASANVTCDWVLNWGGNHRHAVGKTFVTSYVAPAVSKPTRIRLDARCFPITSPRAPTTKVRAPATRSGAAERIILRVPPSYTDSVMITVLPEGTVVKPPHHAGGDLPGTGGPRLWLLLLGLGCLLVGSAAVRSGGRPAEASAG